MVCGSIHIIDHGLILPGYNQGVFSGVLTMPAFQKHMGNYDTNNPADQSRKGWLTSILELGAWFGTMISGFMAESASRKYGILIATGVFIIGVVVQSTAISAGHNSILGGRFITFVYLSLCTWIHANRMQRYGSRIALHDRADVQRRSCTA